MKCSYCGDVIRKFCPECGIKMDKNNIICGTVVPDNHCLFCCQHPIVNKRKMFSFRIPFTNKNINLSVTWKERRR